VKASTEARVLCLTQIATIKLKTKDLDGTKVYLNFLNLVFIILCIKTAPL
jgi:hypothetical protein